MKKLLVFASLILMAGLASADMAKFKVPMDVNGYNDAGLKSAGVDVSYLVTSTTPALATDFDGTTITDGFIHWIVVPSTAAAVTTYLELRSTGTANVTSARLIPRISPVNMSGTAFLYTNQITVFDPPIPFENGLSANIVPAGTAPATGVEFAVGLRWKRQ
jgi:hypothetical protein